ncbi:oxygenase MpaB family protein [Nonomuraea indica]|uniref:Oxygenase MpaB family protein n=1 Tax=Nonomuraea indica TaxID=1581193 RepID=A0ABW8ACL0_9ACTN
MSDHSVPASVDDIVVRPPHTVTWQVHLDRTMWVGGVRGLMLQALHPLAMRGVWQNSTFQDDPFGRLRRTADFVGRVTFGSPEEADEIGRRVRGIHRRLRVSDPDTGRTHRVDEPELLLWVHCAEVSSYLEVARRGGLGLTGRQADRYLDEQRRSATYVGLHRDDVPGSRAELAAYFAHVRAELRVTEEAVAAVRFLLWPRLPRRLRWLSAGLPAYVPFGALCYYTLPGWARRMYGLLPEVPRPVVTAALRAFRLAANSLPEPAHDRAFMPATRTMLRASRERLGAAGYDVSRGLRGLRDPRRWPEPPGR